jgi:hypothetical protein
MVLMEEIHTLEMLQVEQEARLQELVLMELREQEVQGVVVEQLK